MRRWFLLAALAALSLVTVAVAANRFRVSGGRYTTEGAGGEGEAGAMTWAQRVAQPGVVMAVEMSSLAEIQAGADIRDPAPGGFLSYDATENALRIDVPSNMATPSLAWAKSLPYASQFDAHSEFWVQFDVKYDAGLLQPSFFGGGPKIFTIDEGTQSNGFVSGSCTNGGPFPMSGQLQMGQGMNVTSSGVPNIPTMAHSCGAVSYTGGSGQYYGLHEYIGSQIYVQKQSTGCRYQNSTTCIRLVADEWHTITLRVLTGTWYLNDQNLHGDAQVDAWVDRPSLPGAVYIISQKSFDLLNESPGEARYGKIWLLPYDTGRTGSAVDGHVWYRRVLWSSQPLKDPRTALAIVPEGGIIPPPIEPTLAALDLGVTGEDKVGQNNQTTANGTLDHHLSVTGLRGATTRVRITRTSGPGTWETPYNGNNWIISKTQVGTTADYWFEPYAPNPGPYHVKVFYADQTTDEIDAVVQVVNPVLTAAKVGTGTVTSTTPSGAIACGGDCTETIAAGTAFTLTATPGTNYVFSGWSGGGCSGTSTCGLTLQANTTVTATFALQSQGGGLPAIADNTWLLRTPVTNGHYKIDGAPTNASVHSPAIQQNFPYARSYSGINYGGGKLYYFGGAHNSYPGNDIEVYDIATNTWTPSWVPEVCPSNVSPCGNLYSGTGSPYRTPLDRPYSEHTYQQGMWHPVLQRYEVGTRGVGPFFYNPAAATFTFIAMTINPQGFYHPWTDIAKTHMFWSPALQDRIIINTVGLGSGTGIWRQICGGVTPAQWCRVATTLPTGIGSSTPYSTYVTTQGRHFVNGIASGGPGSEFSGGLRYWFWFNATTLTWTPITMPSGPDKADAFDYDTKNDRLILIQDSTNPIKLWSCTTANSPECTQQSLSGPATNTSKATSDVRANLPNFVYDPEDNVFWYHDVTLQGQEGFTALWAYRYKN